jgi:hypothetical protein
MDRYFKLVIQDRLQTSDLIKDYPGENVVVIVNRGVFGTSLEAFKSNERTKGSEFKNLVSTTLIDGVELRSINSKKFI